MLPIRIERRGELWPTRDLVTGLHHDFDRLVDRVFGDTLDTGHLPYHVDVREDQNHFMFEAELPGLTKDDIDVTLEDGVLTISGEKKWDESKTQGDYHMRERRYGRFERSFNLPTGVDDSKVNATLKDGVLTITLDKREEAKPKKINVAVD
jgi:HSP20 family protein